MIDGVGAEIFATDLLMNIKQSSAKITKRTFTLNFYDYESKQALSSTIPVKAPKPTLALSRPDYALDINTIRTIRLHS